MKMTESKCMEREPSHTSRSESKVKIFSVLFEMQQRHHPRLYSLKSSCGPVTCSSTTGATTPQICVMNAKRRFHGIACASSRFMITLKDSSRPPCPPFSSLSSSPAWPTPRAAWLCLCSSSWRLSSSAARVLPWNQFAQAHATHAEKHLAADYVVDFGQS